MIIYGKCECYKMLLALITACGLLAFVLYQTLTVVKSPASECTENSGPQPLSVTVERCDAAPCVVRQGEDAVLNITFIAPRNTTTLTTVATAYLTAFWGITIPIACDLGEKAETCSFLTDSSCPVQAGALIKYTLRLAIPTAIPTGIAPIMEFRVVDEHHLPVTCVRLPVQVESNPDDQTQVSVKKDVTPQ